MERYRITGDAGVYFVTFKIMEAMPVLIDEAACKIITDYVNFSVHNKGLGVNAYVIMPNHLHAVVFDLDFNDKRLRETLDDIRKFTGRKLLDHGDRSQSDAFMSAFKHGAGADRRRKFWQPAQPLDRLIADKSWRQKVNTIHSNPVRKGLVRSPEDWRFSSAGAWLKGIPGNDVDLSEIVW
jgi:putative transposase